MRSGPATEKEECKENDAFMVPSKMMDEYEKLFAQNTEFYSTYNPDMIQEALCDNLHKLGI